MLVKGQEVVERIKDVVCDVCGCSCTPPDCDHGYPEFGTLDADWGYFSNGHDGLKITCHLCQNCFFLVVKHIEDGLGGKVERYDSNGFN